MHPDPNRPSSTDDHEPVIDDANRGVAAESAEHHEDAKSEQQSADVGSPARRAKWWIWLWCSLRRRHWDSWHFNREPSFFEFLGFVAGVAGIFALVWQIRQTNESIRLTADAIEQAKEANKLTRDAQIAAERKNAEQRSYLEISPIGLIVGQDQTLVTFMLTVDGPTHVDIESGEIGISIDDPPLSPEARGKGLYTAKIQPQRVNPRQKIPRSVQVAALPEIHQRRVLKSPPTEVFYVGTIYYWDAFRETVGTRRHVKYFAYGIGERGLRRLDYPMFARNYEIDDPEQSTEQQKE